MSTGALEQTPSAHDSETQELNRLFHLYRLANLNLRYYGSRAERYEKYAWWLDIASGAASAVALFILLVMDSPNQAENARHWAAWLAGLAAVLTAMAPITGWATKAKRFATLHAEYLLLFGQIESVMVNIRRDGLSTESLGASKMVHEAYRQLNAQDEPDPDQDLIDREDKKVREAYPDNYVWTNL